MLYFEELKEDMLKKWWASDKTYHDFSRHYPAKKDKALMIFKTCMEAYIADVCAGKKSDKLMQDALLDCKLFMIETMGVSKWAVDQLFDENYVLCTRTFIERAKSVAPDLTPQGVFQALRNVWTMNSMQLYLQQPIAMSEAVFAYSMLYPLTDNYLDNPLRSHAEKYAFNQRFREKIQTGDICAKDHEERLIFDMIDLIASQYKRHQFPKVYEALLAILDGQTLSISQQGVQTPYEVDVLGITLYKGGASVLADAYLIKGLLTKEEEQFAFTYGVLLQLADDLQDIKEDLKAGHQTVFNQASQLGKIDVVACKTLNMMHDFFEFGFQGKSLQIKALKEVMQVSLDLLVQTALLTHKKKVSKALYKQVTLSQPFSLKAYQKVEKRFGMQLKKIMDINWQ